MQHILSNSETRTNVKRVELLYGQALSAQSATIVTIVIYWIVTKSYTRPDQLNIWLAATLALFASRIIFQSWFVRTFIKRGRSFDAKLWEQVFIIGAFLAGTAWGIAGTWLLAPSSLEQHAFVGFIIAGNTAGAAVAYCSSFWATEAYVLPATIPYTIAMLARGHTFHYAMAVLVIIFVVLLTFLALRLNKSIIQSITLHFTNEDLLNVLRNTQSKIAHTAKMVALGEMAGGIAHEVNTPLSMIHLESEGLRDLCKKNEIHKEPILASAERTDAMVSRISQIVSGLRAFAHETKGEPLSPIAVTEIVQTALSFCRSRIRDQGVTLTVSPAPDDIFVRCHKSELVQALLNLLTNALEAVAKVSLKEIQLRVSYDLGVIKITVADTGVGVDKKIRDKIMQPFFTTKEIGEGVGLGLSVTMGIAKSCEGNLEFKTSEKGSAFTLALPSAQGQTAKRPAASSG